MPNLGDPNTYKTLHHNQNPYNKYTLSNIHEVDYTTKPDHSEFVLFEDLTRKIIKVPKSEIDEKRKKE